MNGPFATYAEHMLDGGYSPVPLIPGQKRPLFDKWDRLKSKAMGRDEISSLVRKHPNLGLGVAGGFMSLVPIDIDTEDRQIVMAVCRALPVPVVAKQGRRGFTAFYWDPTGHVEALKLKRPLGNGKFDMLVEVISTGQTVLPPTIHPDTAKPYRWITTDTLFDVPVDGLSQITPDHIEDLKRRLRPWLPEPKVYKPVDTGPMAPASDKRQAAYAKAVLAGEVRMLSPMATGSGRNDALFRAACKMGKWVHHKMISPSEVQNALIGACQSNGLVKDDGIKACMATFQSGIDKARNDSLPPLPVRERRA